MTLAEEHLKELDNPTLTKNEHITLRCRLAAEFIHIGQYEAAGEALGEFWGGIGQRPNVQGLDKSTAAEVLLRVGALSGWIGASRQVPGSQEAAKDLISESAALFERLGEPNRVASARTDLALCYWRAGAYDEARVLLREAYGQISGDEELKGKTVMGLAVVETSAYRYSDALRLLADATPLFEASTNPILKGSFHNELALVLRRLGTAEHRQDYLDQAIIEYTGAIYHFEQAKHERYAAAIENNLAFLLFKLGRYRQAHEHLDHAGARLMRLKDDGLLAQVDETRARVFLAEKKYREVERVIARAIQTLEKGGESVLLVEALTTQGIARARVGAGEESITILRRAMNLASGSGALSNAGLAALTLIEEHGAKRVLTPQEIYDLYSRADALLEDSQVAEDMERLRACARIVMRRLAGVQFHDRNFSYYSAVHEFEAKMIEQALEEAGGSVTRAARLLGVAHQTLTSLLNTRHKQLQKKRTPVKRRLRSIIKKN